MNNSFSLLKIVSGLSKTLNIANQLIPLYNQMKPMLANGSKILSSLQKKMNTSNPIIKTIPSSIPSSSTPTFFQ